MMAAFSTAPIFLLTSAVASPSQLLQISEEVEAVGRARDCGHKKNLHPGSAGKQAMVEKGKRPPAKYV